MYLILTILSVVVGLVSLNYGIVCFAIALIVLAATWVALIYYPKKRDIRYFSLFTLFVSLILLGLLFFVMSIVRK